MTCDILTGNTNTPATTSAPSPSEKRRMSDSADAPTLAPAAILLIERHVTSTIAHPARLRVVHHHRPSSLTAVPRLPPPPPLVRAYTRSTDALDLPHPVEFPHTSRPLFPPYRHISVPPSCTSPRSFLTPSTSLPFQCSPSVHLPLLIYPTRVYTDDRARWIAASARQADRHASTARSHLPPREETGRGRTEAGRPMSGTHWRRARGGKGSMARKKRGKAKGEKERGKDTKAG
ncbi:uncharacterized protein SCHCODRAFT_01142397 [Schizophyllum commune H4-8]|nr:uncharacterized protein SCHCODRAFT_01142397 [Schizophyllum commune H4-8]KAI5894239.1 hypothetical protein SCHCODRAFT_01142397 [Schizophyllum commune H4-8]